MVVLRQFGKITKEMCPFHRTDVLVHALVHYGRKSKAKLGNYNIVYVNMTLIMPVWVVSLFQCGRKQKSPTRHPLKHLKKLVETHNGWFLIHTSSVFLSKSIEGGITESVVLGWIEEEATEGDKDRVCMLKLFTLFPVKAIVTIPSWKCEYVVLLQLYMSLQ